MTDDSDPSTGEEGLESDADPRDGLIDFSLYTRAQLLELQFGIDRHRARKNYANLMAELSKRDSTAQRGAGTQIGVRWTSRNDLFGWLEAISSRIPFYGSGFVEPRDEGIVVGGWHRTWLGVPIRGELALPRDSIRNVFQDGPSIEFESKKPWRIGRQFRFRTESASEATNLRRQLPAFSEKVSAELQSYNRQLRTFGARALVTPAIVMLNVGVFAAMAISSGTVSGFDNFQLSAWGGNFGTATIGGEWWRLLSSMFLHWNWLHLLANMWVLWSVGRLTERLFGNLLYFSIYLLTGVLAGFASILWNPAQLTVGASGAIFGILGAFVSYMLNRGTRVPVAIVRSYWLPTALFIAFSIVGGMIQPTIDNAAHVGGLLSGLALGWILASPLGDKNFPVLRAFAAGTFVAVCGGTALYYLGVPGHQQTVVERYFATHDWYPPAEAENLSLWQSMSNQTATGSISDADLSLKFEQRILPFWSDAEKRLNVEDRNLSGDLKPFSLLLAKFVHLRRQWAQAIVDSTRTEDQGRVQDALRLMTQATLAQAPIARIEMRTQLDSGVRPLASSALGNWIRFTIGGWKCVTAPSGFEPGPAPSDAKSDGPAARQDVGCDAQRMFVVGDYRALDALMNKYVSNLSDLPDGSSHFQGIIEGLDDLFQYGGLTIQQAMAHTSDWRRAVPGSVNSELVEALMFSDWAYAARGNGYSNTVSPQAELVYEYRDEMVSAGLHEVARRAASNPLWYELSLFLGRNQSLPLEKLEEIYSAGEKKFPDYLPLKRRMLNILMPRWLGSYELIDHFIMRSSTHEGLKTDAGKYARLYLMYGVMEGEAFDVVQSARANGTIMRSGVSELRRKYPDSDYILNIVGRFYCTDGDWSAYRNIRPLLRSRPSAQAWPGALSVAQCDRQTSDG